MWEYVIFLVMKKEVQRIMLEKDIRSHFLWFLLTLFCLFASNCGFKSTGVSASMSTEGTLHGTVTVSPVCPVETLDDVCRPRPLANRQVQIKASDGKSITMTTDQQGAFIIQLPPGRYLIEVQSVSYPMRQRVPLTAVSIVAGQTSEINIPLDTGIR